MRNESFQKAHTRIFNTCLESYHQDLDVLGEAVLPGEAEDVREVEGEVHDAAAGGRQVGVVEEDAEEEALHDGGRGEGEQEEEEDERVAVVQHPSSLRGQRHTRGAQGTDDAEQCMEKKKKKSNNQLQIWLSV